MYHHFAIRCVGSETLKMHSVIYFKKQNIPIKKCHKTEDSLENVVLIFYALNLFQLS